MQYGVFSMASGRFKRSVESSWRGGLRCDIRAGNFVLVADEPKSVGGDDSGPQPTELLLSAVASCFTLAIAFSAKRLSVELQHLAVTATGTYDGPRFRAIHISARMGCDPSMIDALISRAESLCYVTNTLRSDVEISVEAAGEPSIAGAP